MEAKESRAREEGEDWSQFSPSYVSKHIKCPECGESMSLYVGLWVCWCGHEEPCCE